MIELRDMHFAYPDGPEVLRGVSLRLGEGEVLGLMGPSGAGKSSLARQLNGLLRPASGAVLLDGRDVRDVAVAELSRSVGYVFQNPLHQLFADTVRAEVGLGARGRKKPEIERMLDRFNLAAFAERHPLALSEGQRKRVALAAVLATEPRILVLDEPTLGQDAVEKARLHTLVAELRAQGRAVLMITHDAEFAMACCDRLAIMQEGRLRLDGPATEVVHDEQAFLAARIIPPQIPSLARLLGWGQDVATIEEAVAHASVEPPGGQRRVAESKSGRA